MGDCEAKCRKWGHSTLPIYIKFYDKGFDIISISVDSQNDKKDYVAAIKKNKLAWKHVWDKDGVTAKKFNINVFPTYILLDKK